MDGEDGEKGEGGAHVAGLLIAPFYRVAGVELHHLRELRTAAAISGQRSSLA